MSSSSKNLSASNLLFKYRMEKKKRDQMHIKERFLTNSINDLEEELKKLKKKPFKKPKEIKIKEALKTKKTCVDGKISSSTNYFLNNHKIEKEMASKKGLYNLKEKFYRYIDSTEKRNSIYRIQNVVSSSSKMKENYFKNHRKSLLSGTSTEMIYQNVKDSENDFIFF